MPVKDNRSAIIEVLKSIVPGIDENNLDASVNFRDQFEFDSLDYLKFVLGLEKQFGIRIAEVDYPKFSSLDGSIKYLEQHAGHLAGDE